MIKCLIINRFCVLSIDCQWESINQRQNRVFKWGFCHESIWLCPCRQTAGSCFNRPAHPGHHGTHGQRWSQNIPQDAQTRLWGTSIQWVRKFVTRKKVSDLLNIILWKDFPIFSLFSLWPLSQKKKKNV